MELVKERTGREATIKAQASSTIYSMAVIPNFDFAESAAEDRDLSFAT